jgi:hypothetical protein
MHGKAVAPERIDAKIPLKTRGIGSKISHV